MLKHSLLLSGDSPDYLSPLGDKSTGETLDWLNTVKAAFILFSVYIQFIKTLHK